MTRFRDYGPIGHLDYPCPPDPGPEPVHADCLVCGAPHCPFDFPWCSDECFERDSTQGSLDDLDQNAPAAPASAPVHDENPKEELVSEKLPPDTAADDARRGRIASFGSYLGWCVDHPEAQLPHGTILHYVTDVADIERLTVKLGGDWKLTAEHQYAYARREVAPDLIYQLYTSVAGALRAERPVDSFTDLADAA